MTPAELCRLDEDLAATVRRGEHLNRIATAACTAIIIGSALYGAVFGMWRSPIQAIYSAFKMPVLIFSVTGVSIMINTMIAQALGSGLTFRIVGTCMLLSFAVTSILLAAMSPVMLFFSLQCPEPGSPGDLLAYRVLLPAHTMVVGFCGFLGNVKLHRFLRRLIDPPRLGNRVLMAWILVSGLAGCELSWVISPFLARPDLPIPFFNPNAVLGNFFEYLFRTCSGMLR